MNSKNPDFIDVTIEEQQNTSYSTVYPPPYSSTYSSFQYSNSIPQPIYNQPVYPQCSYPIQSNSVFPMMELPQGPLISIYLEDNSHHQKRNRRLGGIGVTAAACAITGGLVLLPVLAGVGVNKVIKKSKEKCVYAYGNTFIYELRSALAHGLGIPPELLQLKRKGVMLDDCIHLSNYLAYPGKNRIHITMHIKDKPVIGSVCSYEGQYVYPEPRYVDCSSYQFISYDSLLNIHFQIISILLCNKSKMNIHITTNIQITHYSLAFFPFFCFLSK